MTEPAAISRILTLVFTDLADSTAFETQRGDQAFGELMPGIASTYGGWRPSPAVASSTGPAPYAVAGGSA